MLALVSLVGHEFQFKPRLYYIIARERVSGRGIIVTVDFYWFRLHDLELVSLAYCSNYGL